MRPVAILIAISALIPVVAQTNRSKQPPVNLQIQQLNKAPASTVAAKPAGGASLGTSPAPMVPVQGIEGLENDMNTRLSTTGGADPCVVQGRARGLYINGFGAVFTADLDLVNSPSLGPFTSVITPDQKLQVHKRKLAHLPLLQNTMRDVILSLAASPALKNMADTDQIVVAVKLLYKPWEDPTGLVGQITLRSDRRGGNIKMEVQ